MRRHRTALICSLFWLITVVVIGAFAEEFSCPGKYNCSCAREKQDEFELSCPDVGEQQIAVQLKPHSTAIFQCQLHTTPDDYNLLRDVHIDAGNLLEFRLCPLPDVPFTDLLQLRNAAKIQTFTFRSHRLFNDTLEKRHFKGLTGITSLSLMNNGLTVLPSDLLEDMPRLQHLYLPNNLVQPPADLFQSVLSLEVLELGKNDLTTFPVDLFRNLKKLQLLNLWKNKLSNLSAEMFKDLISLTSLDLRHNGLTSLPADIFKYLISLKNLSLNGNNFQTLPSGLFSQNKKLELVQFSDSRHSNLNLPSGLFSNLPNLKTVDLYNSGLKEIPEDIFWGSPSVISISLQNNQLKEVPHQLLRDSKDLEKLFLQHNQINTLSDKIFEHCKKMKVLDLSFNKITNLSMNALLGLEQLEDLSIPNNFLRHIDLNTFQSTPNLRSINLANNKLSFLDNEGYLEGGPRHHDDFGDYSPLRHCLRLEKINLSNNSITDIFADWRINMLRLSVLNLSHNALQTLIFQSVVFIPSQNREIDVRHNKISVVDLRGVESWATQNINESKDSKRQRWLLEGNPLQCDCYNYHFLRYLEKQVAPEVLSLVDFVPGNLACAGPAEVMNVLVENVPSKAVTCPLASIGDSSSCPHPCQCHFRTADLAIIVDCIEKNLTSPPAEIPYSSKSNHTELYLTKNKLRSVPDFTLPGYQSISKLALGYNNITSLNNITAMPQSMQIIELDHNNLTVVEPEAMQAFSNLTNLTSIKLHGNPWKCECQLQTLVNFVQARYKQIPNHEELRCTDGQLLTELTVSGLCAHTSSVVWASLVIALMLGGLIGGAFAVYYRFTHEIKAWLFAHNLCLWFVTEEELDKDKLYDAFVSYSHKDEEFVVNELVPGLEGGPSPFKLCLHYRDWVVGEWIPNQITRSVEDSRRTIVVLSPNFLESVWGRLEFRAAHCQALSEGRARVIVVLLGDIGPTENLDPELRAYLNMNTYVKWGDPWFWKKLRYALPHPPKAMKGSVGLVNRNSKHMNGKSTDDKIELICEPNAPAPVTTPPAEGNTADPLSKNSLNGKMSSPIKIQIPSHESNGKAAAVC